MLHPNPAAFAVDPAGRVNEENQNSPEHDELPVSRFRARVVNRRLAPTAPTSRAAALARLDSDLDCLRFSRAPTRFTVTKSLERQHPFQYARYC